MTENPWAKPSDAPETDADRIIEALKGALEPELAAMKARGVSAAEASAAVVFMIGTLGANLAAQNADNYGMDRENVLNLLCLTIEQSIRERFAAYQREHPRPTKGDDSEHISDD